MNYKVLDEWPRGLKYSPQTGLLYSNRTSKRWRPRVVLSVNGSGYRIIKIEKSNSIMVHRLAFLAVTGKMPGSKVEVDHINGKVNDNRFVNLRLVDGRNNQNNKRVHREGSLVGAIYLKREKLWISRIRFKNQRINLGHFKNEIEAHVAYLTAKRQIESTGDLNWTVIKLRKGATVEISQEASRDRCCPI